jgi:replicative DNA helicase
MICNITNKKYQKVKVFLSVDETLILEAKETRKVILSDFSQHLKDLEKEGSVSIKTIEK